MRCNPYSSTSLSSTNGRGFCLNTAPFALRFRITSSSTSCEIEPYEMPSQLSHSCTAFVVGGRLLESVVESIETVPSKCPVVAAKSKLRSKNRNWASSKSSSISCHASSSPSRRAENHPSVRAPFSNPKAGIHMHPSATVRNEYSPRDDSSDGVCTKLGRSGRVKEAVRFSSIDAICLFISSCESDACRKTGGNFLIFELIGSDIYMFSNLKIAPSGPNSRHSST